MAKSFDVGIDSLASDGVRAPAANQPLGREAAAVGMLSLPLRGLRSAALPGDGSVPAGKSFFLETFGCQMNDHDSEKVAGGREGRGSQTVGRPPQGGLVLFKTRSLPQKNAH